MAKSMIVGFHETKGTKGEGVKSAFEAGIHPDAFLAGRTFRYRKIPDAGEDAASKVDASLSEAERKGRAENAERMKQRKDRGMDAFGKALQKHLTNASTCVGVVGVKSFNEPGSTGK
eukprot:3721144-Pyramimonas_sp.AAC.1